MIEFFNEGCPQKLVIPIYVQKLFAPQFRVVSDAFLDDIGDVLESRRKVLELVVAKGNVVGQVGVVAHYLLGCLIQGIKFFKNV